MSQSQTWALSQEANKSNGICSVRHTTRQLHLKDGTVHRHGPRNQPCPGSHRLPLGLSSTSPSDSSTSAMTTTTSVNVTVNHVTSSETRQDVVWAPGSQGLIKFIPKSARSTCAKYLSSLLRKIAESAGTSSHWIDLVNWGQTILALPKRGGKKQNFTTCLKKRISLFPLS